MEHKNGGKIMHNQGSVGGYLVGNSHANGGIKAINKSTNTPLEMEGGEVVITKKAVDDPTKYEFEGEMLTNREILSRINQSGGGVSFADGGAVGSPCPCGGKMYNYGGVMMTDCDMYRKMNRRHLEDKYNFIADANNMTAMKRGGVVEEDLNKYEIGVLSQFKSGKNSVVVSRITQNKLDTIIDNHLVVAFKDDKGEGDYRVILTKDGREFISNFTPKAEMGIELESVSRTDYSYKYFKGVRALYKNPYLINKAIEELLEQKSDGELDSDEKAFLKYYTGYGGLEKYMEEATINKGLLYEYYTPNKITEKMWGLSYKYGYSGGSVLEPSCGIGEFIQYAPLTANVVGYEINPTSARIAKILYPNANIFVEPFETNFINRNSSIRGAVTPMYDLVIGNPPYGKFEGRYAGMGEKDYTHATNYIEYFITRSLDLLRSGGLLVFIVGAEVASGGVLFLDSQPNKVKASIAEKADLIDAYRLPNGVFERTDVVSDIIVLKKK
jgi:hypothetical protein